MIKLFQMGKMVFITPTVIEQFIIHRTVTWNGKQDLFTICGHIASVVRYIKDL
jgi:hypothetical protein